MTGQQADESIGVLVQALPANYGEYPEIVKIEAAHRVKGRFVDDRTTG